MRLILFFIMVAIVAVPRNERPAKPLEPSRAAQVPRNEPEAPPRGWEQGSRGQGIAIWITGMAFIALVSLMGTTYRGKE